LWNKNQIQILCIIEPLEEKNLLSWAENVAAFLKMNYRKIKSKFSAKLSHWKKKIFLNWAENVVALLKNEFVDC